MFEDKIIDFISANGGKYKGRVVACVKDIGITIVNADDPKEFLHCLKMKNAPNFSGRRGHITYSRKRFTELRKGIIKGTIDLTSSYKYVKNVSGWNPSHSFCPFGV